MPVNNLNLLPPELSVSKSLSSLLRTLRALGVIGIAAFLIFGIGVGAFFIISTVSLNSTNANVAKLENQVSSLQKSEQLVILLKDRLAKITSVQELPSSLPNLTAIKPFLSNPSGSISINQMTIDSGAVSLSENIKTNSDLSSFLGSLQSSDIFQSVNLTSFSFSPSVGYSVEISAVRK